MNIDETLPPNIIIMEEGFDPISLRCEHGWLMGSYIRADNLIVVSHINSDKPGTMKALMNHAVKKYGTTKILFYNVLGASLVDKLKGFRWCQQKDTVFGEIVECLAGEWNVEGA